MKVREITQVKIWSCWKFARKGHIHCYLDISWLFSHLLTWSLGHIILGGSELWKCPWRLPHIFWTFDWSISGTLSWEISWRLRTERQSLAPRCTQIYVREATANQLNFEYSEVQLPHDWRYKSYREWLGQVWTLKWAGHWCQSNGSQFQYAK